MKKQLLRVKQSAYQTFLGADKSEPLNQEELRKADLKVDFIQKALTEVVKKLPNNVESQDKRVKKYDEYNIKLSIDSAMQESACSREALFHYVLKKSANTEEQLAHEKFEYERQIEEHVSKPINKIIDTDLPTISKHRKNLNKHILDKDSATNRYLSAKKVGTPKENNLKEEADEADVKLDQSRDALAAEMFTLLRRESEICTFFVQLLKMQRSYHESACKLLQEVIPRLEQIVGENKIKPIFGCSLDDHLKTNNRQIAYPLEICVVALMELGMSEEGLFRLTGSGSRIKRLKLSIDSGCFTLPLIPEYRDVHVLASTLKMYLRELPEPLLTFKLYNEWMRCMDCADNERIVAVQKTLSKLPHYNRDNLAFLMQFLAKLSKHPENRMTTSNIAIVIGPNLLWSQEKEDMNMKLCSTLNMIVELFLTNIDYFFPEDMMQLVEIRAADLFDADEFTRPDINCLRHSTLAMLDGDGDTASPKPSSRKKTRHAPAPPSLMRADIEHSETNYYLSGTGTASLNRPHKIRTADNKLHQHQQLKDDSSSSNSNSSRRSSLVLAAEHLQQHIQPQLVTVDNNTAVQMQAKPLTAQIVDPPAKQTNTSSNALEEIVTKPVAAPRTSIPTESDRLQRKDSMSKSLNSIDLDGDEVTMRSKCNDDFSEAKREKPAIPTRPASLRGPITRNQDSEHTIVKSFNAPYKQQPSLVNIHNKNNFAAGHDNQIAEKEKFLGHQPLPKSLENKVGDINSNNSKPDVPSKPTVMKSTEKLNAEPLQVHEKVNGNPNKPSHIRTRSDGNIVDVHAHQHHHESGSFMQTPPSPRNLNKPSQPPPPPPNVTSKVKSEPETTNL